MPGFPPVRGVRATVSARRCVSRRPSAPACRFRFGGCARADGRWTPHDPGRTSGAEHSRMRRSGGPGSGCGKGIFPLFGKRVVCRAVRPSGTSALPHSLLRKRGRGFVNAAFGRGNGCPETRSGMERQTIARKIDVGSKRNRATSCNFFGNALHLFANFHKFVPVRLDGRMPGRRKGVDRFRRPDCGVFSFATAGWYSLKTKRL